MVRSILMHHGRVTKAEKVAYDAEMAQLINAIRPVVLDQTESISSCGILKTKHSSLFPVTSDEAEV